MIDPIWNPTTENNDQYREVMVDVYAPDFVSLAPIDDSQGM